MAYPTGIGLSSSRARDHAPEDVAEPRVVARSDLARVAGLDLGHDLVADDELLEPAFGGYDQLRSPVGGTRAPTHDAD